MENASKALIIAGAILLSILIIAIGMYIYNSSTNSIYSAADQISAQDQEAFNSQWTSYEENQPGSSVKSMISRLISNATTNEAERTKLPNLIYEAVQGETETVESTIDNPNIADFNSARSRIQTKHTYFIELHYSNETSLVDCITIHYEKPDELPTMTDDSYVD